MVIRLNYNILTLSITISIFCGYDSVAALQEHEGHTDTPTSVHSKLTLEEEFSHHEQATIRILGRTGKAKAYSLGQQNLGDQIIIDVTAFKRTFTLKLTSNKHLIHPSYVEKTIDGFGTIEYQENANTTIKDCYYVGSVANESYSAAAASTCSGLSAQILSGGELYHIEPMDNTLTGRHRAFRQADSQLHTFTCDHVDGASTPLQFQRRKKRATLSWPQDLSGVTRVVEYYVINDFSQYTAKGNDTATVTSRAKTIVNFASLLFQQIDVYITLVGMETWTDGSLIALNRSNPTQTLNNFKSYRITRITQRNDHAQLLTSFMYSGGVMGLTYLNGMCDPQLSVAIVGDVSATPGYTSTSVAHELGHSFGMLHDDQIIEGCSCVSGPGRCIMNSSANGSPATQWSTCSQNTMTTFLAGVSSYCLNDFNNVLFDSTSVCGNGLVEGNEQCDCGNAPSTECNQTCCDPVTCSLMSNASCAAGLCCDINTCRMKPLSTICRAAAGPCDLVEYCSGVNNTCPSDAFLHDGTNCTVAAETSYCYNGLCRTQTTQCGLWWGDMTTTADDQCYSSYNVVGDDKGNCAAGRPTITGVRTACSASDVKCGLLHCDILITNISQQLVLNFPDSILSWDWVIFKLPLNVSDENITSSYHLHNCTAGYSTNGDPAWVDPGYVPDGAVCGTNKMCVNRRCVATSSVINTVPCPFCNDHGVCNSLGQCHCNVGYSPPDCSLPGNGGSYHSNAIQLLDQLTTQLPTPGSTSAPTLSDTTSSLSTSSTSSTTTSETSAEVNSASIPSVTTLKSTQTPTTSLSPPSLPSVTANETSVNDTNPTQLLATVIAALAGSICGCVLTGIAFYTYCVTNPIPPVSVSTASSRRFLAVFPGPPLSRAVRVAPRYYGFRQPNYGY